MEKIQWLKNSKKCFNYRNGTNQDKLWYALYQICL